MEDLGGNVLTEVVTIVIDFVNDHDPELLLDGSNLVSNYQVPFFERQDHIDGAVPVRLSDDLTIIDEDAGDQYIISAVVSITDGE